MNTANESAFPQHGWSGNADTLKRMEDKQGLTKRELFAAMAMQGMASDHQFMLGLQVVAKKSGISEASATALAAIEFADALIAALASKESTQ